MWHNGAQQEKVVGGARWRTTWGPVVSERQWLKVRRWRTTRWLEEGRWRRYPRFDGT
ncbi:hypothetical protein LINPERPRIM_LOCUS27975 [Linum perenne]